MMHFFIFCCFLSQKIGKTDLQVWVQLVLGLDFNSRGKETCRGSIPPYLRHIIMRDNAKTNSVAIHTVGTCRVFIPILCWRGACGNVITDGDQSHDTWYRMLYVHCKAGVWDCVNYGRWSSLRIFVSGKCSCLASVVFWVSDGQLCHLGLIAHLPPFTNSMPG